MPYSKYYKILGLPNNASQEEIRKKYRKLAMQYHPDINPNPNAQLIFIQLTEAYNILQNKVDLPPIQKTRERRDKTKNSTEEAQKVREQRIKEAKRRQQQQQQYFEAENEKYYQNLIRGKKWNIFKIGAFFSLAISLLLMIDHFLPNRLENDKIITYNAREVLQTSKDKILISTQNKHTYFVQIEDWDFERLYTNGTSIIIQESSIFHMPYYIHSKSKIDIKTYPTIYTMGQLSPLFIIIFAIPFLTYYYKRKSTLFVILFRFSLFLVNFIMLYFLFSENRFIHLITLGNY
ncbi:MAG: J domain-containing protein [Flavobacteriia bacterium]|nr:J domain-containing protein [Flavobacteriia bacterium]